MTPCCSPPTQIDKNVINFQLAWKKGGIGRDKEKQDEKKWNAKSENYASYCPADGTEDRMQLEYSKILRAHNRIYKCVRLVIKCLQFIYKNSAELVECFFIIK